MPVDVKPSKPSKAKSSKAANPRKRRRQEENDEDFDETAVAVDDTEPVKGEVTAVSLSKDALLTMSSAQVNDHLNRLRLGREFTKSEQAEIARMKRLVRNRESAQASRQRKRDRLDELEAKVKVLEGEKMELAQYAHRVEQENARLRQEMSRLHSLGLQFGSEEQKHTTLSVNDGKNYTKQHTPLMNDKTKKAATTLLVLCFAFGIWMKAQTLQSGGVEVQGIPRYVREPIPTVVGGPLVRTVNTLQQQKHETPHIFTRDLKELAGSSFAEEIPAPTMEKATRSTTPSVETVTPAEFVNESVPHSQIHNIDESPLTQYLVNKSNEANHAVMTCSNLRQIVPANASPLKSDEPLFISLLVPPTGSSAVGVDGENGTQFVEITCQVMQVKTVTLLADQVVS